MSSGSSVQRSLFSQCIPLVTGCHSGTFSEPLFFPHILVNPIRSTFLCTISHGGRCLITVRAGSKSFVDYFEVGPWLDRRGCLGNIDSTY